MRSRRKTGDKTSTEASDAASVGGLEGGSRSRPLICGNWKMHHNHFEAIQNVQKLAYALSSEDHQHVEVCVHPPFTDLRSVQTVLQSDDIPIALGAQDCHSSDAGAFTGEVSAAMLAKLDVTYVIVGHSERRGLFGESSEVVNAKARAVMRHGMTPIVCVGETLEQRRAGQAREVVSQQIAASLSGLDAAAVVGSVLAYEPVWAIGTGETATPGDAQDMCAHARAEVAQGWGSRAAEGLRILYGGSVKPFNAADLMEQPDIDGALVGGASLDAAEFARIVNHRLYAA
ncbi:MAG: triose-phosphate isomerase [Acidimicrobiaceae bacterium]|nr:triose-phosphate isomerase [Acidimicrobiaceae bacterium]MCY4279620.1 triose-phosphate isomerase [Acidimicrobiaceae bacterium]MCY4295135.1 triose-phosphate isomerase [Acidimicrobiaceae bacterium]